MQTLFQVANTVQNFRREKCSKKPEAEKPKPDYSDQNKCTWFWCCRMAIKLGNSVP